jgi:hypothetical protein
LFKLSEQQKNEIDHSKTGGYWIDRLLFLLIHIFLPPGERPFGLHGTLLHRHPLALAHNSVHCRLFGVRCTVVGRGGEERKLLLHTEKKEGGGGGSSIFSSKQTLRRGTKKVTLTIKLLLLHMCSHHFYIKNKTEVERAFAAAGCCTVVQSLPYLPLPLQ